MNITRSTLVFALLAFLLAACASEQTVTKTQVKKDAWGKDERFAVGKDKDGNPIMKSDRRSSLEGKRSNLTSDRDFNGQDYSKKSYRKKRWGGNTIFSRKSYQGNTDASHYKNEPWFVKKQANAANKRASANGKSFSANPFRTSTARENTASRIPRTSDAETDFRRRVFKQPEITGWKNQSDMSVKDTNRLLGR